jgi:tol-pal system protein YbgF
MIEGIRRGRRPRRASGVRSAPGARIASALIVLAACGALPACTPPSVLTLRGGLDSLRAVVDTMSVRDSVAFSMLADMRREIAEQHDILLSTRATTGTTTQEMFEQMGQLSSKLDEAMGRFNQASQRSSPSPASGGGDVNQLYDQAAQDLTQGRYAMALQGFRDFVRKSPKAELADNAQYGAGECFFAQSQFDSAAVEYQRVVDDYPQGDKVAAAMYKLGLSQEKLRRTSEAKKTFEDLVRKYPMSGEAQLARERLGTTRRN